VLSYWEFVESWICGGELQGSGGKSLNCSLRLCGGVGLQLGRNFQHSLLRKVKWLETMFEGSVNE
jgi:hypothetical protein